jgi:hypothetical protein
MYTEDEPKKFGEIFMAQSTTPHYYGDTIRKLFFAAAFVMLFFMPFFNTYIPLSIRQGLLVILALSLFSGLTNPKLMWIAVMDMIISAVSVFIFGYYAVDAYLQYTAKDLYFWVNHILAVLFLVSLYFSIKTVRGFLLKPKF